MAVFPLKRPSHVQTSSLDSNSDQTIRRGTSESPIPEASGASTTFPEVVDLFMRRKNYLPGVFTEETNPTPAFRVDNRLQDECVRDFLMFEK